MRERDGMGGMAGVLYALAGGDRAYQVMLLREHAK